MPSGVVIRGNKTSSTRGVGGSRLKGKRRSKSQVKISSNLPQSMKGRFNKGHVGRKFEQGRSRFFVSEGKVPNVKIQ